MHTRSLIFKGLIIFCVAAFTACRSEIDDTLQKQTADAPITNDRDNLMQIELDIFSGRPNPQWTLTQQQVDEWNSLLKELPEGTADTDMPPGLGYRGFIVTPDDESQPECEEIRIFRESITVRHECSVSQLIDRERSLERFLFDTSRSHIEDGLYEQIKPTIEGH